MCSCFDDAALLYKIFVVCYILLAIDILVATNYIVALQVEI